MPRVFTFRVNGGEHHVRVEPETPLIYVLRNDLGLKSAKLGCGLGQCGHARCRSMGEPSTRASFRFRTSVGARSRRSKGSEPPSTFTPCNRLSLMRMWSSAASASPG